MCLDILYNICLKQFFIQRIIQRDIVIMCASLHVKYLLFSSYFNKTWIFSTDFRNNTKISNFIKIRPVGAELVHAGERSDRNDESKSRF